MVERICIICSADNSKYRCPKCRETYCSLPCSKLHKDTCSTARASAVKASDDQTNYKVASNENIGVTSRGEATDMSFALLSDAQKEALEKSPAVREAVRSKRLQSQLESINSASNRQAALKKARTIPEFEEFIEKVLSTVSEKALG